MLRISANELIIFICELRHDVRQVPHSIFFSEEDGNQSQ